ncbi:MAG TPA: hypothetical protein VET65_00310 [Candidatus Limnocylindrales bacterium]|nr:hypothetical protein [Candidatus Limnocylindrales bacterium]
MVKRRTRSLFSRQPMSRVLLFAIGIVTPLGILVVNASAFVMHNLTQFRLGIAACALISSLVLNGLTASWLLRLARRRAFPLYVAHPDWAVIVATVLVLATSIGAAIFTFIGMRDPARLPDGLAVLTAFLALFVPLGLTYLGRLLSGQQDPSLFQGPTS